MTYVDRLNDFNRWIETNTLPANSQLMYFKLLNIFNRAGWPEWVQIDNIRLMSLVEAQTATTALRARDRLAEAGWIEYKRGVKGSPNKYCLKNRL